MNIIFNENVNLNGVQMFSNKIYPIYFNGSGNMFIEENGNKILVSDLRNKNIEFDFE